MGGPGSTETYFQWGQSGDQTAQGDYDGDGKTDFSIYRGGTTGYWWITRSSSGSYYSRPAGNTRRLGQYPAIMTATAKPIPPSSVHSNSTWYIIRSSDSTAILPPGGYPLTRPRRPTTTATARPTLPFGVPATKPSMPLRSSDADNNLHTRSGRASTDKPVSADYDGDGTGGLRRALRQQLDHTEQFDRHDRSGHHLAELGRYSRAERLRRRRQSATSPSGVTRTAIGTYARAHPATRCDGPLGHVRRYSRPGILPEVVGRHFGKPIPD